MLIITWSTLLPVLAVFIVLSIWALINNNALKNREELVRVPYITNMRYIDAEKMLQSIGLGIKSENEEYNSIVPEGFIIDQTPSEGNNVMKDTEIKVSVSRGQEESSTCLLYTSNVYVLFFSSSARGSPLRTVSYTHLPTSPVPEPLTTTGISFS